MFQWQLSKTKHALSKRHMCYARRSTTFLTFMAVTAVYDGVNVLVQWHMSYSHTPHNGRRCWNGSVQFRLLALTDNTVWHCSICFDICWIHAATEFCERDEKQQSSKQSLIRIQPTPKLTYMCVHSLWSLHRILFVVWLCQFEMCVHWTYVQISLALRVKFHSVANIRAADKFN